MRVPQFAVFLPDASVDQTQQIAERMRVAIEFTPATTSSGELRMSVSIGVSGVKDSSESITALLARADAAPYKAKASGRNPVVGSAPVVPPARRTSA